MKVKALGRLANGMGYLVLVAVLMAILAPGVLAQAPDRVTVLRSRVGLVSTSMGTVASPASATQTGTIVSMVYQDWDQDGEHDASEPRLAGATVVVMDREGREIGSRETDEQGMARFERVRPGTYTVVEHNPFGYSSSTSDRVQISIRPGEAVGAYFGDILVLR